MVKGLKFLQAFFLVGLTKLDEIIRVNLMLRVLTITYIFTKEERLWKSVF